jgi:hypothetical protein
MYRAWNIMNDPNHQQYKLTLLAFDGTPLPAMWLKYNPPAMWPGASGSARRT